MTFDPAMRKVSCAMRVKSKLSSFMLIRPPVMISVRAERTGHVLGSFDEHRTAFSIPPEGPVGASPLKARSGLNGLINKGVDNKSLRAENQLSREKTGPRSVAGRVARLTARLGGRPNGLS